MQARVWRTIAPEWSRRSYYPRMHIGHTPLVRLQHVVPGNGVEIWVKWEGANPTGSMKDRMALSMVQGAVARGQRGPRGRLVEYTGGSTGGSLAMVCASMGYRAHFVSSNAFAGEKLQTMRAFGARVEVLASEGGKIPSFIVP
jgi:cysteine synthase